VGSCRRSPIYLVNADMPDIRYHYRSDTNCQARNLGKEDAMDRGRWKKLIKDGGWVSVSSGTGSPG